MAKWLRTRAVSPIVPTNLPTRSVLNQTPAIIEPTKDELRNGWTAETLTQYLAERKQAHSSSILDRPQTRPGQANSKYDPTRWRG